MNEILPRGIRNNNPGNIRHGAKWEGLTAEQPDPSFCVFKTPQYGIRALSKVLRTYQKQHGLKTVYTILNRYAPAAENDTNSYIAHACQALGVKQDDKIDVFNEGTMLTLIRAIIRHENGQQPYSDAQLLEGIRMT